MENPIRKQRQQNSEACPVSFINDKPEEDSCQRTQPYNHFDSFFTDRGEETLALK